MFGYARIANGIIFGNIVGTIEDRTMNKELVLDHIQSLRELVSNIEFYSNRLVMESLQKKISQLEKEVQCYDPDDV